jgi:MFS family permease
MNEWLPIIAGLCIIGIAFGIVRFAPNSVWGQELRRSYGVRPTGARGNRTRRDHLRSAGLAAAASAALLVTSLVAGYVMDRTPDGTSADQTAWAYLFTAFMLAAIAALALLRSLWKATVWRIELPDTPEHRRRLADAIDHLVDGVASGEERAEFLDVRYLHPQIEQVRRATLKLVRQHRADLPDHFRRQIKQWTAGIRGSVE